MSNEISIFILFIFCGQLHLSEENLYRLGSKTHYNLSVEIDKHDKFMPILFGDNFLPSDKFLHMYGNFRHGTRYPGKKDVENGLSIMGKLKNLNFSADKYQEMNDVIQDMKNKPEYSLLSPSGKQEHRDIGRKYGGIFKELNFGKIDPSNTVFGHTFKSRAMESMEGFIETFLPVVDPNSKNDAYKRVNRDDMLRFFDLCTEYINTVKNNKTMGEEKNTFMNNNRDKLLSYIKEKVGLPGLDLTNGEISAWVTIAGFELAINRTNNWLKYLDDRILEIVEYASDLSTYYEKGPGVKINYAMSCGVIKEIFGIYDEILAKKSKEIARFYFSHAETLIPLLNIIGLFRGDPPLKHNTFEANKNREFKTTRVAPFATNFVFVLMERGKIAFIRLYFKGEPYQFSFCKSSICEYSKVLNGFVDKHLD
ncbi:hypothetical protein HELRODRAFT_181715 [Helobdella robusta]|uniref:Multiple inositol polyphosphate phosphatase 1 n=1 Tax=Helobdella robusta TaxID=6412 RepID=T1FH90_HELRO|nr:hypothetical protein HELRODRAFT_181715 [Helobdella robusta]ESN92098.1 hypothetical protein HELRODRAFT_181715 [Helobdella robusta]